LLVAISGTSNLHAAAAKKPTCKPGVDKNFAWQRVGFNEARKLEKPILLYIYDPQDGKASDPVKLVQQELFANAGVKQAFAEFTPILQPLCSTSWPPVYTSQAKNGVALFILTCDAVPVAVFTHKNLPKAVKDPSGADEYPLLRGAADAALKANPKALAALKKNPPKEYLSPEQLAARREAATQPPEPEPKENAAAGLLEEEPKKDTKTADAKKKPEDVVGTKGSKPVEENE
jgi:hypothetical protein